MRELYIKNTDGGDCTEAVLCALFSAGDSGEQLRLRFGGGEYHFRPERACERFAYISNNDSGLKRVAFPIENLRGFELCADGASFVFHGALLPFLVRNCEEPRFSGFSVECAKPFFVQGELCGSGEEHIDLRLDEKRFPFEIIENRFFYKSDSGLTDSIYNYLELDPSSGRPSSGVGDDGWECSASAERLGGGIVRFHRRCLAQHSTGNAMVLAIRDRQYPAFCFDDCSRVSLKNITVHSSRSMALVAQLCDGVALERFKVQPKRGSGLLVSACADATHFVNCTGDIFIDDCVFKNQLDDAVNCHGIYAQLCEIDSGRLLLRLRHPQQAGINPFRAGCRVSFSNSETLEPTAQALCVSSRLVNREFIEITIGELSGKIEAGEVAEAPENMPSLHMSGCSLGDNRARGVLLTSPKPSIIEKCRFFTAGSAVLMEGDAQDWFESGAGVKLALCSNEFVGCCSSPWGEAVIQSSPKQSRKAEDFNYHSTLEVRDNRFVGCFAPTLKSDGFRTVVFKNNEIEKG